ncbi:MAG: glycosyltransferase family 4 protein [Actinobacteria bacterium]|nr:glycosyltransferase family 4 protein [Actinomycetota bacterium]MCL6105564.1 glycosyltransferase family 4 protein [Actinomycetota bacterium]
MNQEAGLTVLLAPGALRWDPQAGSEHTFMYGVVEALTRRGWRFRVVTEDAVAGAVGEVVSVGKRHNAQLGGVTLPIRVAKAVSQYNLASGVNIVHHGLPFALGQTFSLLPYLANMRYLPFIVGPVQPLQTWSGRDEGWASLGYTASSSLMAQQAERLTRLLTLAVPKLLFGRLNRKTLGKSACVVATGETALELLISQGVPEKRCRIVRPPVHMEFFNAVQKSTHYSASFVEEGVKCVSAGWMIERKEVNLIIDAFAHAKYQCEQLQLVLVGDGPQRQQLEQQVVHLGLGTSVSFTGKLSRLELIELLAHADIYVAMSRSESFGMAVAEAMAMGLPVVSASNIGACELLRHQDTGYLVGIDDVNACAAALCELASSADLRHRIGTKAQKWALTNLHPDQAADHWEVIYREALSTIW